MTHSSVVFRSKKRTHYIIYTHISIALSYHVLIILQLFIKLTLHFTTFMSSHKTSLACSNNGIGIVDGAQKVWGSAKLLGHWRFPLTFPTGKSLQQYDLWLHNSSLFMVFPCFLLLLFSTTACNPIHDFYSCFPPRGNGTLGLCICWFLANTLNHTTPGTPQDMMSWAELHRSPQGALSKLCLLRTGLKHRMTAGFLQNTSVFLMP